MSTSTFSTRVRRGALLTLSVAAIGLVATGVSTQSPRFYSDDPIAREPESQDAGKAAPYEQSQFYELAHNLFVTSGYKPSGLRAKNINTIDEVPDSSWFTNRVGTRPVTTDELVRGANVGAAARSIEVGADPGENVGGPSGLHREGCEGRDLVPRVRSALGARRRDRRRRDCDQDFLGRSATTRSSRS